MKLSLHTHHAATHATHHLLHHGRVHSTHRAATTHHASHVTHAASIVIVVATATSTRARLKVVPSLLLLLGQLQHHCVFPWLPHKLRAIDLIRQVFHGPM